MSFNTIADHLKPTPAKLFFLAIIVVGWGLMVLHSMQPPMHHGGHHTDAVTDLLKIFSMWGIMVLAMMVPTVLPLFNKPRSHELGLSKLTAFIFGYILSWLVFCAAVTALQWGLRSTALLDSQIGSTVGWLSAGLLMGAGMYQFTGSKKTYLKACRLSLKRARKTNDQPIELLFQGLEYGGDCIKCCWPMMLTMFAFGLMNLWAMAALTVVMVIEKTGFQTRLTAKAIGVIFIVLALVVIAS